MKWNIALILVFLLLIGCGQKTVYVCSDETQVEDATECAESIIEESMVISETIQAETIESIASEETAVEPATDTSQQSYVLSDSEKALLAERFTPSVRAVLSTPLVKNLHIGDVYVVGLAVQNILGASSHDFVVDIKFREAKDFSGSILETDDELVQAWFEKNIFTTYTLQRNEEITLPIIIEVGDYLTETGDPVIPGTYIYDVYISYITNAGNTDEYQDLVLTVQVTE
ncbi:MAG: hypothetical protein WC254_02690 [Candidatus Woesearchaeota archaeon]|jgi:hypothetical protein